MSEAEGTPDLFSQVPSKVWHTDWVVDIKPDGKFDTDNTSDATDVSGDIVSKVWKTHGLGSGNQTGQKSLTMTRPQWTIEWYLKVRK